MSVLKQAFDDVGDVGEVAVVREDDAVGRVHVERLRFGDGRATGGRIAHMADAHGAQQARHVAGVEDVGDEAVALVQIEAVFEASGNARGILPAVLEHGERIVNDLADRACPKTPTIPHMGPRFPMSNRGTLIVNHRFGKCLTLHHL